jgi:hypothetical protein
MSTDDNSLQVEELIHGELDADEASALMDDPEIAGEVAAARSLNALFERVLDESELDVPDTLHERIMRGVIEAQIDSIAGAPEEQESRDAPAEVPSSLHAKILAEIPRENAAGAEVIELGAWRSARFALAACAVLALVAGLLWFGGGEQTAPRSAPSDPVAKSDDRVAPAPPETTPPAKEGSEAVAEQEPVEPAPPPFESPPAREERGADRQIAREDRGKRAPANVEKPKGPWRTLQRQNEAEPTAFGIAKPATDAGSDAERGSPTTY